MYNLTLLYPQGCGYFSIIIYQQLGCFLLRETILISPLLSTLKRVFHGIFWKQKYPHQTITIKPAHVIAMVLVSFIVILTPKNKHD
jgi:hypothetical protein